MTATLMGNFCIDLTISFFYLSIDSQPIPRMKNNYIKTRSLGLLAGFAMVSLTASAQMPANLNFSAGNFSNWTTWTGASTEGPSSSSSVVMTLPVSGAPVGGVAPGPSSLVKSRHAITTGSDTDYYAGFPIVCPAGTGTSARIGNDQTGAEADRIRYHIHVPATSSSYNIQYQYAVVFEDPGHAQNQQPSFQVIAYDSATGAIIPGANNMYIAKYLMPGFNPRFNPLTMAFDSSIIWLPWTAGTANLSGMGGKTVILECTALDCSPSGHWGYGYFDVTSVQDSLTTWLRSYNTAGDSVTLEGPAGFKSYTYYSQDFSQAMGLIDDTARVQTVAAPLTSQYYNVVLKSYDPNGVPDTIRTPRIKGIGVSVGTAMLRATKLYPNPANEKLLLQFAAPFTGTAEIRNATGALVWTARYNGSTQTDIPVATLPGGIYSLKLQDALGASDVRQISIRH